ncbi:diacylglycerol kinase family protein [Alkalihalophilus lindianensis]|uniref:Diacylglycerol kinase family protein n=1 Tax=Alkalihalophilus lindianensis TaxID=1630542 RepID=A0ABU3X5F5_9BACI|nr:diacylglycerol kinase family protein [Alkalihalophilus lindianensis]MDV2683125.1 diacylglycerol kinase family protein [Alkalihalophilus lindianensis]
MGLQDRNKRGFTRLLRSFGYAFQGLKHVFINEQNMQVHFCLAIIVFALAVWLDVTRIEWLILLVVVSGIFALEIMNTAIERTVDLVTEEYHPIAKRAKDVAASAVFVYSVFAVIIGLVLFIPYLLEMFL